MKTWFLAVGGAAAVCLCLGLPAWAQEGVGARIGKQVDQAVGEFRVEAEDLANQVREGFERARAAIEQLGVAGRVYARLRWDKALSGASVSVDVPKEGLAVLRGTVPNEAAMKKAVELAHDTVGVEQVRNDLRVAQAAARPPAATRR